MAAYNLLMEHDHTFTLDMLETSLQSMETRVDVRRLVFRTGGTAEEYVWVLPSCEENARNRIQEFENGIMKYLEVIPATGKQIRDQRFSTGGENR
jgi:hypothetical protein